MAAQSTATQETATQEAAAQRADGAVPLSELSSVYRFPALQRATQPRPMGPAPVDAMKREPGPSAGERSAAAPARVAVESA